jgi:protocatechuate 3,4-dioxygenase beta subunit
VQESDADGKVTFKTIFPAAYAGRWPHIHFEVYESLGAATAAGTKLRTSQMALPQETCDAVYATEGYEQSVQNLSQTSLDTDNVFSDGYAGQLAGASGGVADGITLTLNVGV